MMQWLLYALLALAAVIAAVLLIASRRPNGFRTERSVVIAAPRESIFPRIADLRAMNTWNPFVEPDPAIRIAYCGPERGKGAVHTWAGNRHVGEGRLEVLEAEAPSRLDMRLQMFKPFKADNLVEFRLVPEGAGTRVSWAMSGQQPLLAKAMTMFFDCDRMVGGQFEKGLAKLKAQAEA